MNQDNKKRRAKRPTPQLNLKCPFNGNPANVDYKDTFKLKKLITTRGRILPPSKTGVSAVCQRKVSVAIKRARYLAMLPYSNYV